MSVIKNPVSRIATCQLCQAESPRRRWMTEISDWCQKHKKERKHNYFMVDSLVRELLHLEK